MFSISLFTEVRLFAAPRPASCVLRYGGVRPQTRSGRRVGIEQRCNFSLGQRHTSSNPGPSQPSQIISRTLRCSGELPFRILRCLRLRSQTISTFQRALCFVEETRSGPPQNPRNRPASLKLDDSARNSDQDVWTKPTPMRRITVRAHVP